MSLSVSGKEQNVLGFTPCHTALRTYPKSLHMEWTQFQIFSRRLQLCKGQRYQVSLPIVTERLQEPSVGKVLPWQGLAVLICRISALRVSFWLVFFLPLMDQVFGVFLFGPWFTIWNPPGDCEINSLDDKPNPLGHTHPSEAQVFGVKDGPV